MMGRAPDIAFEILIWFTALVTAAGNSRIGRSPASRTVVAAPTFMPPVAVMRPVTPRVVWTEAAPVAASVVKVPAAGTEPPMTQLFAVPPDMVEVLMVGLVSVLFVKVSVVAKPTRVSEPAGSVIVPVVPAANARVHV